MGERPFSSMDVEPFHLKFVIVFWHVSQDS
jgi:hypothetical protein